MGRAGGVRLRADRRGSPSSSASVYELSCLRVLPRTSAISFSVIGPAAVAAELAAHVGQHVGDLLVGEYAGPRRHLVVVHRALDVDRPLDAVQQDVRQAVGRVADDPFRGDERRELPGLTQPLGLMALRAVGDENSVPALPCSATMGSTGPVGPEVVVRLLVEHVSLEPAAVRAEVKPGPEQQRAATRDHPHGHGAERAVPGRRLRRSRRGVRRGARGLRPGAGLVECASCSSGSVAGVSVLVMRCS